LKLTRIRVEKYKDVDRDENRHTFLKLLINYLDFLKILWTCGNRSSDGFRQMQLRNRRHIHFWARTPGLIILYCNNTDVVEREIRYRSGTDRPYSYDDLSGSYINQVVKLSADFISQAIRRGIY